jgi:hypothetical protein
MDPDDTSLIGWFEVYSTAVAIKDHQYPTTIKVQTENM